MKLGRTRDRERMRNGGFRRGQMLLQPFLFLCALVAGFGLLMLALRPLDPPIVVDFPVQVGLGDSKVSSFDSGRVAAAERLTNRAEKSCATVEEMGHDFRSLDWKETLRVRRIIRNHFVVNGTLAAFVVSVLFVNLGVFLLGPSIYRTISRTHVLLPSLGSSVLSWSIILFGAVAFGKRVARTF